LGSNPQQRQEFFQKYNNIKKLTQTGELWWMNLVN
jgi:hypothetical protein